jgi:hypothetical protein
LDDIAGDIDDVEATRGAANKLGDIDEWIRKGLIDIDEYEWFRRGLRSGVIGGLTAGGFLGLLPVIGIVELVIELSIKDELLSYLERLKQIGWLVASLAVLILAGLVGGGITGAAVGRFAKGNSGWCGPLSMFAGAVGGFAMIVFVGMCFMFGLMR